MGQPRRGKKDLVAPVLLVVLILCHTTSTPSAPPEYRVEPSVVRDTVCTDKREEGGMM